MSSRDSKMSQKGQSPKKGSPSKASVASPKKEEVAKEVTEPKVETPEKKEVDHAGATSQEVPTQEEEPQTEMFEDYGAVLAGMSSWFTSKYTTAKEKSSEMYNYLKQDFSEFSETVTEASKDLKEKLKLDDVARTAVTNMASTASVVLDQMSTIFGVGPDDDDEAIVMGGSSPVIDRINSKIYSLAYEEDLFLNDPANIEGYEKWLVTFDLEKKSDEMRDLMSANPHLQLHYGQLVPDKVSHLVFWHRFYFRVHELYVAEEENEKSRRIQEAAKRTGEDNGDQSDEEKGDSDPSLVEISEEDQKRLLAEYEEEMKNSSAQHSRRSSGTHLSSSSSGSFAMVTHDTNTDEVKCD